MENRGDQLGRTVGTERSRHVDYERKTTFYLKKQKDTLGKVRSGQGR